MKLYLSESTRLTALSGLTGILVDVDTRHFSQNRDSWIKRLPGLEGGSVIRTNRGWSVVRAESEYRALNSVNSLRGKGTGILSFINK